jgi:hypothetical protein
MPPKISNKKRKPGQPPRKHYMVSTRIGFPLKMDIQRFAKQIAAELGDKQAPFSEAVRYLCIHALRQLGVCRPTAHALDLPWERRDALKRIALAGQQEIGGGTDSVPPDDPPPA